MEQGTVTAPRPVLFPNLKPRRSLQSLLVVWFLFLSLCPLIAITLYSIIKYEQALDDELIERLKGDSRELSGIISQFSKYLTARSQDVAGRAALTEALVESDNGRIRSAVHTLAQNAQVPSIITAFEQSGRVVASHSRAAALAGAAPGVPEPAIFLAEALRQQAIEKSPIIRSDDTAGSRIDLVALSVLRGKNGDVAGFLEEVVPLDQKFLETSKARMALELSLFNSAGRLIAATNSDLMLYPKDYFATEVLRNPSTFFDIALQGTPLGLIVSRVEIGDSRFFIGLGTSKERAKSALHEIRFAFFSVMLGVAVFIIIGVLIISRLIMKPLNELLEGLRVVEADHSRQITIPINTQTEFGVLGERFNFMAERVHRARKELEQKVLELEASNKDLQEAQVQLVHAAKMASLGQLVAGIAHELNNPVGFVYSNIQTLREYSDRLMELIESLSQASPAEDSQKLKNDADYGYISVDLPKLLTSCEDGSRRIRDLVLKLRSFSRLDEAQLKEVDLREGVESTLMLLRGEIKDRVEVHVDFEEGFPLVTCFASQINQVLMNILANAAQAIRGEGEIWIRGQFQPENQTVSVSIRDSGDGIPKDVLPRILDPFFTTKEVGKGTGLGLSISYRIMKEHGGDLLVHSEPGRGAEFKIVLPIRPAAGRPSSSLV